MITERQEKVLDSLIQEYIKRARPVGSEFLCEKCFNDVSPATIRNDLQELAELGYVSQLHTSSGRVPTTKAYRYFIKKSLENDFQKFENFISKEIKKTKKEIEKEMELASQLTESFKIRAVSLSFTKFSTSLADKENQDSMLETLEMLGPSKAAYKKNIEMLKELLKELEGF